MPYTKEKPPQNIKNLPSQAQDIWIAAFNDTYDKYDGDENLAYSVAWAAVRNGYEQDSDGKWHQINQEDIKSAVKLSSPDIRIMSSDIKEDVTGYKWRVQIIDAGLDKNNVNYPLNVLKAAKHLYEGARVFALSEAQHTVNNNPYGKSVRDIVGWLSDVADNTKGLEANLKILKSAKWLRDMVVDAWDGKKDIVGLSHDVFGKASLKDGVRVVEKIIKVDSVDVVYEPAAGGKFLRMAAAKRADGHKEEKMLEKLLAALKMQRADLYKSIEGKVKDGTVTEDEVLNLLASAVVKTEELDGRIKAAVEAAIKGKRTEDRGQKAEGSDDPAKKILDETRIVACSIILKDELKESGLPELSQQRMKKQYEGKLFDAETLRAAIKDEKEYLDKLTGSGSVTGSGGVKVTKDDMDNRIEMMDDFFERKVHSFKAAYINLTGDEHVTGRREAAVRLTASLSTTSFDQILGDSIRRKMVKEYAAAGLDDWRKIVEIVPASDFRTQRRVRFGGYGNLPTVLQGGAYEALSSPTDEEATYSVSKKGGTEDLTLEMIKNDDVGVIRKIPQKLGRSAARTLYEFVFDFLATNPIIYDSKALFHTDHANLGSAALDATSLAARRKAMLIRTEMDSSKRLGIGPKFLVVSVDLDKTAYDLVTPPVPGQYTPTAPDFIKRWAIEVIVVIHWTDANNFFLVANPADIPTIEIAFLDGNETPELFVQDNPQVGSLFSNDKLTYKIRQIYGGGVIDHRAFDGSIVPG